MTIVWIAGFSGLLLLCLGALVGNAWTEQALDRRHKRLTLERRALDEWRHALEDASVHCVWCGHLTGTPAPDHPQAGDRASATMTGHKAFRNSLSIGHHSIDLV